VRRGIVHRLRWWSRPWRAESWCPRSSNGDPLLDEELPADREALTAVADDGGTLAAICVSVSSGNDRERRVLQWLALGLVLGSAVVLWPFAVPRQRAR
jgi:hypothetical protein